jgi:protein-S-isoprenylcysteine O-methyltransferase Ste14
MHKLELKIPPAALVLITAAFMWLAAWAVPAYGFDVPARDLFSMPTAVSGAIISAWGIISFRQARTTVNPMKPDTTTSLVVSGIYRWTRNPMYLGFLLVLLGWAIFLSNALSFILVAALMLYLDRFQVKPEERALHSLFGQQFAIYASRVRRWL